MAFFPGYPAVIRTLSWVTGNAAAAGIAVTFAAGAAVAVLFGRWSAPLLGGRAARSGLVVLFLFPYAYYLVGAIYAVALFLAATLLAFVLLESDRPLAAGVAGIVATATRPVGLAVCVGLAARAFERRRGDRRHQIQSILAVTVSALSAVGYSVLLAVRFGDPLAFAHVADAPGWDHHLDRATLLKHPALSTPRHMPLDVTHTRVAVQGALTLIALALIPWASPLSVEASVMRPRLRRVVPVRTAVRS